MSTKVPTSRSLRPAAALVAVGAVAIGAGLWLQSWWIITGGVVAMTGAAWLVTEPR